MGLWLIIEKASVRASHTLASLRLIAPSISGAEAICTGYLFSMRKSPLRCRLKTFLVALDHPGVGWSGTVRALTRSSAIKAAKRKFGELPDTVYEVPADYEKIQAERREQEIYERLDSDDFLIALGLAGVMPNPKGDFPNERMLRAMTNRLGFLMTNKPKVDEVEVLLNRR